MIALLATIYCVGLYLIFIKYRLLPFNLVAQICVGLVGFVGLLVVLFGMNFTQPFSVGMVVAEYTTPVAARVPGRVTEVPVENNSPVRKGDVLFKMDPQPYALNIANDDQKAALALYGQTVLQAFSEVETSLTNERFLRDQQRELLAALDSEEIYRLENVKYRVGQVDMEPVLQLESVVLATKMANTEVEFQLLANRIGLHLALGGDF